MKASEVYLRAAELAFEDSELTWSHALLFATDPNTALALSWPFADLFIHQGYGPIFNSRSARVIALLLMSEIAKESE